MSRSPYAAAAGSGWSEEEEQQRRTVAELQRHSPTTSVQVASLGLGLGSGDISQQRTRSGPPSSLLLPLIQVDDYQAAEAYSDAPSLQQKPAPVSLLTLVILGAALVLAFILNNVTWVFLSDDAGQTYAFAMNQITSLILIAMQAPYVLYNLWSGGIPMAHVYAVPWRVLLVMGSVDGLYDVFVAMGSVYTPGPFQTILFQLPIPLTMLIAYAAQRKRFPNGQYVGGLVILAGAIVSVIPGIVAILHNRPQPGSNDGAQIKAASVLIYAIGVLVYSCNVVYKEHSLKHTLVNVWWFSLVVSSINFVVSFFLIPLLWIPGMGNDQPNNTFQHLWAGAQCVFTGLSTMDPSARCHGLWWLTLVNVSVNVLVNVLTLQIVRVGSALLLQVVGGVQLPLCNLVYAAQFIMGARLVTPMTHWMVSGAHTNTHTHSNERREPPRTKGHTKQQSMRFFPLSFLSSCVVVVVIVLFFSVGRFIPRDSWFLHLLVPASGQASGSSRRGAAAAFGARRRGAAAVHQQRRQRSAALAH